MTGMQVRHLKSDGIYTVLARSKHKQGDTWTDTIVYRNERGEVFTREVADFTTSFTPVPAEIPARLPAGPRHLAVHVDLDARTVSRVVDCGSEEGLRRHFRQEVVGKTDGLVSRNYGLLLWDHAGYECAVIPAVLKIEEDTL